MQLSVLRVLLCAFALLSVGVEGRREVVEEDEGKCCCAGLRALTP